MNWKIIYTIEAENDVTNIYDYIVATWNDFAAAKSLVRQIVTAADSLEQLPLRHQVWGEEPWCSQEITSFPVERYIIVFSVNVKKHAVEILRIIYGGQDISKQDVRTKL